MGDATRMVDNYHMCWTGIREPMLTIDLDVPLSKSSEVVHQYQEPNHVRALFLQLGGGRGRFKAMRRSWKRRTWRRWSTFRRLGGAPFCLLLERGIFYSVGSYFSCGYNTSSRRSTNHRHRPTCPATACGAACKPRLGHGRCMQCPMSRTQESVPRRSAEDASTCDMCVCGGACSSSPCGGSADGMGASPATIRIQQQLAAPPRPSSWLTNN